MILRMLQLGCLALLASVVMASEDAPDANYKERVGQLAEAYAEARNEASETYAETFLDAGQDAVEALVRLAERSARGGEHGLARVCWIETLRIDRQHEQARAFLSAIGQLEAVLEELSAPVVADDFLAADPVAALPEPVRAIINARTAAIDEALADWTTEVSRDRDTFAKGEGRERLRLVRDLERTATRSLRRGDMVVATTLYRTVISYAQDHAEAREFFTQLGTLETVLAELGEPLTVDNLIGPLGTPDAAAAIAVSGSLNGDGLVVAVVSNLSERGGRLANFDPVWERLEERGFTLEFVKFEAIRETLDALEEIESDLLIVPVTQDTFIWQIGWFNDNHDLPIICLHPKLWMTSRLLDGKGQGQYNYFGDELTIAEDHPIAAGLTGTFRAHTFDQDEAKTFRMLPMNSGQGMGSTVTVATAGGHPAVLAVDAGAAFPEMHAGTHARPDPDAANRVVPARRVGLFYGFSNSALSPEGWVLFDNAVTWALAGP